MMIDGSVISVGESVISQAALFGAFSQIAASQGRLDGNAICAEQRRLDGEALVAHQQQNNGRLPRGLLDRWDAYRNDAANRTDALGAPVGAFPRELEFIRAQELMQARKPLNGDLLFPIDRSVPLGARYHTWRRRVGSGEAVVTRGDTQNYGHASTGRLEEQFPIAYIVCSVRQNYFEMLGTDYAGIDQYSKDLAEARRIIDERKNRILFNGHTETQLYGALNHPQLMKKSTGLTFGGSSPSTADAIVTGVNSLIDAPANYSGEAFQPTILAVSPKIYRYMAQTRHATGTDTTIMSFLLAGQDKTNGIREIRKVQELAGIGPAGEDGLLAFRDEVSACAQVEVSPTMPMPMYQSSAMSWLTVMFCATGGIVMPDVGNNILGFATAS